MKKLTQGTFFFTIVAFLCLEGCTESLSSSLSASNDEDLPILCRDEKDNDGDGRVDCDDPDCQSLYTCESKDSETSGEEERWTKIYTSSLQMGSNDGDPSEAPEHIVLVRTYEIMRTEVTVAEYRACVEDGGCDALSSDAHCASDEYLAIVEEDPESYPMNCLSWHQAAAFCAWFGGRLPSEPEWEQVASNAQNNDTFPWGDDPTTCDLAVIDDGAGENAGCGLGHPWPVCSKEAGNAIGGDLCDAIGNVQEWMEDDVHRDYTGAPTDSEPWIDDPRGEGRVVRGGAYYDGPEMTAMTRRFCDPEEGCDISDEMDGFGVRCAR